MKALRSNDPRPNVLWICTDQQRFDTLHALNNPRIFTPNLDRLCAEGVAFTYAFCQSPICTPSRASFLTGLYGELYDLEDDPRETRNRWDDPACAALKYELLRRSFDAAVMHGDTGPKLIGRY